MFTMPIPDSPPDPSHTPVPKWMNCVTIVLLAIDSYLAFLASVTLLQQSLQ